MTSTQTITTDSFKEVTNRNHSFQPGLEAVYHPPHDVTYAVQPVPQLEKPVPVPEKRRVNLWLFIAVGILGLAVIGLAVGLGVGLSRGHASDAASSATSASQDPDSNSDSTSSPSPSATTPSSNEAGAETYTTTVTRTISSPSSTSSPSSPCPSANNTITAPSLGSIRYRIHCDSDIGGSGKITLSSIVVDSFDECLALCNTMNYFQDRTDVGATYNVAGTGTQTPGTCWCLGGEGLAVTENVGNDVAFPVDD